MAQSRTPLYGVWVDIKRRCFNKSRIDYINYGGRGITLCEKWLTFDGFKKDMGNGYKKGLTLDRVDNNGNYEMNNCRWVSRKVQSNNTRRNRYIEYNGITKTLSEWSEYLGIKRSTLGQRFYVYKWPLNKCFSN